MSVHGIDVSQWQGSIDFAKVKADGIKFVIIRCNNWDTNRGCVVKDSCFETNYKNAKSAGLDVGAYYYTWEVSAAGAKNDAALCMDFIKNKRFEYPIYFDLEWQNAFNQGRMVCSNMVRAFCDELERNGWFAGLYISRSPLQTYITSEVAGKYALWIAEYGGKLNYDGNYGMWQNSSTWKVNGISGNVDHDYVYVDYPSLIKAGGYNGFAKPSPTEKLDTEGFKKGDKELGVLAYKQLLILAKKRGLIKQTVNNDIGFGGGTEIATNQLLDRFGYVQNGIAGANLIKRLGEAL